MPIPRKRLGDVLIECKLITPEQLDAALKEQKESKLRLGELLIKNKLVTQEDIIWALGDQLNISYVHLTDDLVNPQIVKSFPEEQMRTYRFIPIFKMGRELTVVMADPLDIDALNVLESLTSDEINISIGAEKEINDFLDKIFGKKLAEPAQAETPELFEKLEVDLHTWEDYIENYGIRHIFSSIINEIINQDGKVIYLEPGTNHIRIRFRSGTSSELVEKLKLPRSGLDIITECILELMGYGGEGIPAILESVVLWPHLRGNYFLRFSYLCPGRAGAGRLTVRVNRETEEQINLRRKLDLVQPLHALKANPGLVFINGKREQARILATPVLLQNFVAPSSKITYISSCRVHPVDGVDNLPLEFFFANFGPGMLHNPLFMLLPDAVIIDGLDVSRENLGRWKEIIKLLESGISFVITTDVRNYSELLERFNDVGINSEIIINWTRFVLEDMQLGRLNTEKKVEIL